MTAVLEWKDCEEPKPKEEVEEKGKDGKAGTTKSECGTNDGEKKAQSDESINREATFLPGPMKVTKRAKSLKGKQK